MGLGAHSEAGDAFFLTGLVTALVAIVWSVLLAIRPARAASAPEYSGSTHYWVQAARKASEDEFRAAKFCAAILGMLATVELDTIAFIGWGWLSLTPWAEFEWVRVIAVSGYPVFAPVATGLVLISILVIYALRFRSVWLRRLSIGVGSLFAALLLIIVFPCALWVLGASARARQDTGWNELMNTMLPDSLKVAAEKICTADPFPRDNIFRQNLFRWGQLPVWRLEQRLSDYKPASHAWMALGAHSDDQFRIALAVARGQRSVSIQLHKEIGQLLAERGDTKQLEELLDPAQQPPPAVMDAIIDNVDGHTLNGNFWAYQYDSVQVRTVRMDVLPALEKRMVHGTDVDEKLLKVVQLLYDVAAVNATLDDTEWKRVLVLWTYGGRTSPYWTETGAIMSLCVYAHDGDPVVRRLAIALLAKMQGVSLMATPPCSAVDQRGTPVAVTLEESEEAAHIAESARLSHSADEIRKCILQNGMGDEREWDWFAASYPAEAQSFAPQVARLDNVAYSKLVTAAGKFIGRSGAPELVRAMMDERKNMHQFVEGLLRGIADGQRKEFEPDIREVAGKGLSPAPVGYDIIIYEGTLCALMTADEVKAFFDPLLTSGNHTDLVKAARLVGYVHDEKLRLEVARRMMSLSDEDDRRVIFIHAKTLSPMTISDPKLRAAWVETLTALLDDPDLIARRAGAFALAEYFLFSFTAMPATSAALVTSARSARFMDESKILTAGRPLPETPREIEEMDALRKKIAANKKLKESRLMAAGHR